MLQNLRHTFKAKNLLNKFTVNRDSAAPAPKPATSTPLETQNSKLETPNPNPSSLIPDPSLLTRNSKLETTSSDPWPPAPDPSLAAPEPQPKRDTSATDPRQKRRQLRKMLRHQRHIFKAKNFVQNLVSGWKNNPPAATQNTSTTLDTQPDRNVAPPDALKNKIPPPAPPAPPPPESLGTRNSELETPNSEPETQKASGVQLGIPSRTADELFEISHGYKRDNPPKHIPDRHRIEGYPRTTIFGDVKEVLKHVLG